MNHHVFLKHIDHLEVSLEMLKELKSREIISPPAVKNEDMKVRLKNFTILE